jgi:hypothetical protein
LMELDRRTVLDVLEKLGSKRIKAAKPLSISFRSLSITK